MASTDTAPEGRNCLRCGRKIKSGSYGPKCLAKVRQAERIADLSAWTAAQAEDAELAILDGAVVPSSREGVFHVVSSDGSEVHKTHRNGCSCVNGLKTLPPRPCWHRCAVAMVLASSAPAAPAAVPAAAIALPAPAPATVPSGDIWAALEAAGALDLVPAF